ncbi:MAG: hypothetical protein D3904_00515 [Candidatus Electrothrix sp. EH2]|nr:hypothetical protein [Candidatus Electrothrix sp. EH2]
MNSETLKQELRCCALAFAEKRGMKVDSSHSTAVFFSDIKDCFHPDSYQEILKNPDRKARIQKTHSHVSGAKEMQSSNSSDALLMNIFCHPEIGKWKGMSKLIGGEIDEVEFGFSGKVTCCDGKTDRTEIDVRLTGCLCEAKLTESNFTTKRAEIVEKYVQLKDVFHVESLPCKEDDYENYQLIRNFLAAAQHKRKHILFCDERRPDLVRRYMETVSCLREVQHSTDCRVIFWQELVAVCGSSLRMWMKEKYGM